MSYRAKTRVAIKQDILGWPAGTTGYIDGYIMVDNGPIGVHEPRAVVVIDENLACIPLYQLSVLK
jgi:hypothetical protein